MTDMQPASHSALPSMNGQHPTGGRYDADRRQRQQAQQPHQQPRRNTRPLSEAELNEVMETAQRVPGLGRMLLSLVRNRAARVVVPETALGGELIQIVSELDRLSRRAEVSLTRNLSPEKMQLKSAWDLQAVNFIQPLAQLAAQLAAQFDNHENPIARHVEIKRLLREMRQKDKGEREGVLEGGAGEAGLVDDNARGSRRAAARDKKTHPQLGESAPQTGSEQPISD